MNLASTEMENFADDCALEQIDISLARHVILVSYSWAIAQIKMC